MAKKHKKHKHQHKVTSKPKSNIKTMHCVDCPKDPFVIVKIETCKACQFRDADYCTYVIPRTLIEIVSASTPLKFNRVFFQASSQEIADSTRNYYLHRTDILKDTWKIPGYPNYAKLSADFFAGKFKEQPNQQEETRQTQSIEPVMALSLIKGDSRETVLIVQGERYGISDLSDTSGNWDILYYLYDMVGLDGMADIHIRGRWYKVKISPIEGLEEKFVVAKQNEHVVIGRIQ